MHHVLFLRAELHGDVGEHLSNPFPDCCSLLQQLEQPASSHATDEELEQREEMREKFRIVRTVLEQGGQFSGINRKVQLKPVKWASPAAAAAADVGAVDAVSSAGSEQAEGEAAGGSNNNNNNTKNSSSSKGDLAAETSAQAAAAAAAHGTDGAQQQHKESQKGSAASGQKKEPVLEEALMILKYGGVLTHAGRQQAEDLGRIFRLVMYPRCGWGWCFCL